ncbi:hypothetical protein LOZ53_003889 [Ophidiomyces ophidiicola]|uniref:Uncharacterized protein n=1 Tax=Ophidiomyces ophidiicola TaxID=1387563 RepID=A0ACB8UTU4_9EURO|nr:uncharacterized protein LOZ57_005756 [Ophidiomyces ophidiicola]KAI1909599.1 hypothetical protein LOZ61_004902 [Ophidiomyces ophidiicola]KAI1913079.1 hypothetical protein LOZ64_004232 [Ophidiomyces ophidiicola]KAI1924883.1 hypothetical protein LOZ60_004483 [Ophidiomyces ophidiicola]KAI1941066.1 hypothetical protein LOZ57_005756 [Ophidiomyces ophidiicola]KAI1943111.1 hypothetical protein LOZ62_004427 [Ophidiomyces ophidiicola]
MDSMRSLNSSLPSSNSTTQRPEVLLQAFKTAALSVTNLYKSAVADQIQSRHIGYQDALEDLRAFLDKEGLGISDGEGNKIRHWIAERIDGTGTAANDSDDEKGEPTKTHRGASPNFTRKESVESSQPGRQVRSASPPRQDHPTPHSAANDSRPTLFTFNAGPQFPSAIPEDTDMRIPDTSPPIQTESVNHSHIVHPSVRLEVLPRGPRTPHRSNSRHNGRSSTRDPSSAIGSKRKFHFNDFFDISNIGNGKDGFGGGKRGRFL